MRLLSTTNYELQDYFHAKVPKYAILSHTWEDEEVTYEDIKSGNFTSMKGFDKLHESCRIAKENQYEWIWIDTCCIDKSSSAELSEAINSMYRWYQEAAVCYAYLSDLE